MTHFSRMDQNPFVGINEFTSTTTSSLPMIREDAFLNDDMGVVPVIHSNTDGDRRGGALDFRNDNILRRPTSFDDEIDDNDETYQISIRLPGVLRACDVTAQIEYSYDDGSTLHVTGGRQTAEDGRYTETRFDKLFTIGRDVDTTKLTAHLVDGVLKFAAPKIQMTESGRDQHSSLEPDEPKQIVITSAENNSNRGGGSSSDKAKKTRKASRKAILHRKKTPVATKKYGREWCCNVLSHPLF